jgi:Zn finger protein HypA/HybF involved in hydrogenase expression
MTDINCPYCDAELNINHDDGFGCNEDEIYQQECSNCEKTFCYTTKITFNYFPFKADCLNGENHKYEKTHTCPVEYTKLRCSVCGDEKPIK